jgi:putative tryptophan/tyrosine transport system substrate-binding protein
MKPRRTFLLVAGAYLALPLAATPQPADKIPRIGFLSASAPASIGIRFDAFRQGLKDLGYVDGRNIVVEYRWAEGKEERLSGLADDLVRSGVQLIVTGGPSATRAAKQASATTPIVMAFDTDPVDSGFVASLARPGGNITGLSSRTPETIVKQIELLKQIAPKLSRLVVLADSSEPGNARVLSEAERAARALGIEPRSFDIRGGASLEHIFRAAVKEHADGLLVLPGSLSSMLRVQLADHASKNRLPAIYAMPDFVAAGGLMTYSVRLEDMYRRSASYVDKILKGAKPGDLPVEQPYKFDLVINLKAARQIGLTIPVSVLTRADRVIE